MRSNISESTIATVSTKSNVGPVIQPQSLRKKERNQAYFFQQQNSGKKKKEEISTKREPGIYRIISFANEGMTDE